ncbi:fibronectin type III domain-containing protein [Pseudoalteromonas rubra]|uniref:fibronectin type III domain-containing protein n=1 Tax=Pseudoalteromonas rubra TaxID=43658 RepID=UPI0012E07609|nr:fibronectin type III domain-containing protein [Pseudoalteromonas rubra]
MYYNIKLGVGGVEEKRHAYKTTKYSQCKSTYVIAGGTGAFAHYKTYSLSNTLIWQGFNGAGTIEIQTKKGNGSWTNYGSASASRGSHSVSFASAGTYSVRIRGCNGSGSSKGCTGYSQLSNNISILDPGTPQNLGVAGQTGSVIVTSNEAVLNWSPVNKQAGSHGFNLYYQLEGSDTKLTSTSTSMSNLTNGETYKYKVRACITGGLCSAYSDELQVTVQARPDAVTLGVKDRHALVPIANSGITFFIPTVTRYQASNGTVTMEQGDFTLIWNSISDVAFYELSGTADGVTLTPEKLSVTEKAIRVSHDGEHQFKVRACKSDTNCGDYSTLTVKTNFAFNGPNLTAKVNGETSHIIEGDSFELHWSSASAGATAATRYVVMDSAGRQLHESNTSGMYNVSLSNKNDGQYCYSVTVHTPLRASSPRTLCVIKRSPVPPIGNFTVDKGTGKISWSGVTVKDHDIYYLLKTTSDGDWQRHQATNVDVNFNAWPRGNYTASVKACYQHSHLNETCSNTATAAFSIDNTPFAVQQVNTFGTLTGNKCRTSGQNVCDKDGHFNVSWNANVNGPRPYSYRVARGTSVTTTQNTSLSLTNLPNGLVTLAISACSEADECSSSVTTSVYVEKPEKPKNPAISAPQNAFGAFDVSWPKANDADAYEFTVNNHQQNVSCNAQTCTWSSGNSFAIGTHTFELTALAYTEGASLRSNTASVKVNNRRDETYLLRKKLYEEEADNIPMDDEAAGLYAKDSAAFRYQTRLFERSRISHDIVNRAINSGPEFMDFGQLWDITARNRAESVKSELEAMMAQPTYAQDEIVHKLWLDVIHDMAEAELILSNQYMDKALRSKLAEDSVQTELNNLANAEVAAGRAYAMLRTLLANTSTRYATQLDAYSAVRGKRSPRYWEGELARPVYTDGALQEVKRRSADGSVRTERVHVLFGGYKDVVMAYNVMAQKLDVMHKYYKARMLSGDLQEAYYPQAITQITNARQDAQIVNAVLTGLFRTAITNGSDVDELPVAYNKFTASYERLESMLSWLEGETNLLGLPYGAFPVLHNHNVASTFDYLISDNLVPKLISDARTAYTSALSSYDTFKQTKDTIAQSHNEKFSQYNQQLKQLLGWEFSVLSCTSSNASCLSESEPTEGSQAHWQKQSIEQAKLNLDRANQRMRNLVGYCLLTDATNGAVTYELPEDGILTEEKCDQLAAEKGAGAQFEPGLIHTTLEDILNQKNLNQNISNIALKYGNKQADIQVQLAKIRADAQRAARKSSLFGSVLSIGASLATGNYAGAALQAVSTANEINAINKQIKGTKKEGQLLALSTRLGAEERVEINDAQNAYLDLHEQIRIRQMWFEAKTLQLDIAQAELQAAHEAERLVGIYKQASWVMSQMQQLQSNLAKRYVADPIHGKRLSKAMLTSQDSFDMAQEWLYYAMAALENKWNTPFNYRDHTSQSVMRARNAEELNAVFNSLKAFNTAKNVLSVEQSVSTYSLKEDGFGYYDTDFFGEIIYYPNPTPENACFDSQNRCTAEEAFARVLNSKVLRIMQGTSMQELLGLRFSTAKSFDENFGGPARIVDNIPPGYEPMNCLASGGTYLNKIKGISVNIETQFGASVETLPVELEMSGMSVMRTSHAGTYVYENGEHTVKDEFIHYPLRNWRVGTNGKLLINGDKIIGSSNAHIDSNHDRKSVINAFNEQNVGATDWLLKVRLGAAGQFEHLPADQIRDIKIDISHQHASRVYDSSCYEQVGGLNIFNPAALKTLTSGKDVLPQKGNWVMTSKGPYLYKSANNSSHY